MKQLVSICCLTYNHQDYIRDALESFLMQKTTFPIEIIIHDDASTDKTTEIVKQYVDKYPGLIIPIFQKENQFSKTVNIPFLKYILPKTHGKYIALCEGDDYWTNPYKLQKQVDYMERHPECSLCFHAVEILKGHKRTGRFIRAVNSDKIFFNNKLFLFEYSAPTPSLLFQKRSIVNPPIWFYEAPVGDVPLKLILSQYGTAFYINEIMAVRRVGFSGSWSDRMYDYRSRRSWYSAIIKMLDDFNKYSNFKYSNDVIKEQLQYEIKGLIFQDKINTEYMRKLFKSNKYRDCIQNISFKKKVKLYLIYLFPNFYKKIYSSKIGWSIKKLFFYHKI